MTASAPRRLTAEAIGTAMLLAAVVGSGIMADRLSGGNQAVALLANTIATAAALAALILTFGPISGAHFNPAVSIADASQGGLPWREVPVYVLAQVCGAVIGVWIAHVMFGEPDPIGKCPVFAAVEERIGWWAEVFEIPCVGYSGSLETISPLVAAGADFIALGDAVWREPGSIAETIREAGRHLRLLEPAR